MIKTDNLVTIIVTSYNYGQYLDECIGSLHSQTYKFIEIIVVDDGSDDLNTIEKLKELEKKGRANHSYKKLRSFRCAKCGSELCTGKLYYLFGWR